MHIVIETLHHLMDVPKDQFDQKRDEVEQHIRKIDINDIPQKEFRDLYSAISSRLSDPDASRVYNALKLLAYISSVEVLCEMNYRGYIDHYEKLLARADPSLSKPLVLLLEHLDEILRDYSHRISEPEMYAEFTSQIQQSMQQDLTDLLFRLQELESQVESELPADSTDFNHDLWVLHSSDTRDPYLRMIREGLEVLTGGILEKILHDEGYMYRSSKLDPELEIIGRYQSK